MLVPGDGKPTRIDLREAATVTRFSGRALEGLLYDRPFAVEPSRPYQPAEVSDAAGFRILLADYVTQAEGTGAVHTAPLFGEDDERSGREYGLPELQAVDAEGRVALDADAGSNDPSTRSLVDEINGDWFKDADPKIVRSLRQRGHLLHGERHSHSYPYCWRCDQPLLYYATTSWFIRTTAARDQLIEKNRQVHWHPKHVGEGTFRGLARERRRLVPVPQPLLGYPAAGLEVRRLRRDRSRRFLRGAVSPRRKAPAGRPVRPLALRSPPPLHRRRPSTGRAAPPAVPAPCDASSS